MRRMIALAVFVGCLAVWLLLALAISRAAYGQGTWTYNRVVRVVDGDTLVLNRGGSEVTCRLIGVNTPETKAPGKPVEFYGPEASAFVKLWLEGKTVRVDYETYPPKLDRYGRLLVYLYADKGRELVNRTLIERGYAQFESGYPTRFKVEFREAEEFARSLSLGLWSDLPSEESEALSEARRALQRVLEEAARLRKEIQRLEGEE
jgi:micrococcal nuclease